MSSALNVHFHSAESFLAHGLKPLTSNKNTEECSICQQSWADDPAGAVTTPCEHDFHGDCLTLWLTTGRGKRTACPLCRQTFFTESSHNVDDNSLATDDDYDYDSEFDEDDELEDESARVARLSREAFAANYLHAHQVSIVNFVRYFWEARARRRNPNETWGRLVASTLWAHRHSTRDLAMRMACREAEFEASFIIIDALLVWGCLSREEYMSLTILRNRVEGAFAAKKMQDAGWR